MFAHSADLPALHISISHCFEHRGSPQLLPDGNLVLHDIQRNPIWASNTGGNDGVGMLQRNDGNVVIYAIGTTQAIFATVLAYLQYTDSPWGGNGGFSLLD